MHIVRMNAVDLETPELVILKAKPELCVPPKSKVYRVHGV